MDIRDRVRDFRRVPASGIRPSPFNWRTHPGEQADALRGLLAESGFAGAVLARELPDGSLEAIDGHLRLETMGDRPVLVTDLDEAEAKKLLATFDPLGTMAGADTEKLDALLAEVSTDNSEVAALLDSVAHSAGLEWGTDTSESGQGGDEFDPAPEPDGSTRTSPGDLWGIGGKHRLLVGDCTVPENVGRLMVGVDAEMMESLRQAQLTVYRNPGKIAELAEDFRGPLKVVPGKAADPDEPPAVGGKAHPRLWAAFTLSGPGQ